MWKTYAQNMWKSEHPNADGLIRQKTARKQFHHPHIRSELSFEKYSFVDLHLELMCIFHELSIKKGAQRKKAWCAIDFSIFACDSRIIDKPQGISQVLNFVHPPSAFAIFCFLSQAFVSNETESWESILGKRSYLKKRHNFESQGRLKLLSLRIPTLNEIRPCWLRKCHPLPSLCFVYVCVSFKVFWEVSS